MFEGESDRLLLLTAKNKMTFGGPRMAASFKNFDENPVELQIRGKILSNKGKILLDDLPIARFEAGLLASADDGLSEPEIISRMAVAPLGTFPLSVCSSHLHGPLSPIRNQLMSPWL